MAKPILMVKPQHVELRPEPIRPEWIISGTPTARSNKLATSRDNTSNVIVWDCTPGQFQWRYSQDETVVIVAGEAFITGQDGIERRLGPGELAFFPAGTVCTWRITETIRKAAVLRETMWGPMGFLLKISKKILRLGTPAGSAHGAGPYPDTLPTSLM
jgi:uncharacterized cupin superfamily protein